MSLSRYRIFRIRGSSISSTRTTQATPRILTTASESHDRDEPFTVRGVGTAPVIAGWNGGLLGMHEGGQRLLVIPPHLGYGAGGQGPIPGNATLVFRVEVLSIAR